MDEIRVKQYISAIYNFGICIVLAIQEDFELHENYEECHYIQEAIKRLENNINETFKKKYSKEVFIEYKQNMELISKKEISDSIIIELIERRKEEAIKQLQ